MENFIVIILLLLSSAFVNVLKAQTLQKFQQPQEQASPAPPAQRPQSEARPAAAQPEKPPPDAIFYREISWSPDGSRIGYSSMQDGKWNVYVMGTDGSQPIKLTNDPNVNNYGAAWSPDSKQIAFGARHGKDSKTDIYVMNADGSNVRQLTSDPANDSSPAWSPDGKHIAFISDRDGKDHEVQIYVMRADGSEQTRLIKSDTHDYDPQWSPYGRRLVYYAEKGEHKDQIWIVNADGSNPTLLTGGVGHNIFPSWSPDGKLIIFTSHRDGPEENMTIHTMKPDGTNLRQLSDQQAFMARFARDGSRIGFLTGRYPRNAIYVMNADGSGLKKITP
jgi:Tol biopolymer transport system component